MREVDQEFEAAVPLGRLSLFPGNPNEGDLDVIAESVDELGFYGAVIAQKSTGKILAGNHRFMTAADAGAETLPVIWADVTDEDAAKILAVDNGSNRRGTVNRSALLALLQPMESLRGTSYTADDLMQLLKEATPPGPPSGFPGYDPESIPTEHECPRCGYRYSGTTGTVRPAEPEEAGADG